MSSVHLLNQPVVLDLGSGLTKGGYAGTPEPSVILGTLCGTPRLPKVLPTSSATPGGTDAATSYSTIARPHLDHLSSTSLLHSNSSKSTRAHVVVGQDLHRMSGVLSMNYPMQRGVVEDWNAIEQVWRHVCHDLLSVTPGEHPFLITEAALNPRNNREKLGQFFFESLGVPALHVAIPGTLSLFASGRTSGLVLDVGDSVTTAIPVAQGHCDIHAIQRVDLAGRDVTDRMLTLLRKSGASLFATSSEWQAVRRLKEKLAYVAINPSEEELRASQTKSDGNDSVSKNFQLPDGNLIRVATERFRAPEILFQPQIIGREFGGVQKTIASAINNVDIGLRRNMYSNILLAGGSTKFKGFGKRLLGEMREYAPSDTKVRIVSPPDRLTSAFTGGTILASLSTTFKSIALTRQEYFEKGSSAV